MTLLMQDPFEGGGDALLETLIRGAAGATGGFAMFAFASARGVHTLLEDEAFNALLRREAFELVVGIDRITDTAAITALQHAQRRPRRLNVRAFVHNRPAALFHPKLVWFRNAEGGTLIAGSGNLTMGGLRGNWEGAAVVNFEGPASVTIEGQWQAWVNRHDARLLPLDDDEVEQRAARNAVWNLPAPPPLGGRARPGRPVPIGAADPAIEQADAIPVFQNSNMLVAEIPRGGNRWQQGNFSRDVFNNFFSVRPRSAERALLAYVSDDGTLHAVETRPAGERASDNFGFELGGLRGINYPANGRPIVVFARIAPRTFLYEAYLPGDVQHAALDRVLTNQVEPFRNKMRRLQVTSQRLRVLWPNSRHLWDIMDAGAIDLR
jgi:HKD family nuclease